MAYSPTSAILNGAARPLNGLTRWSTQRAVIASGGPIGSSYHFEIQPAGYMYQPFPVSRIQGGTPVDFRISLDIITTIKIGETLQNVFVEVIFVFTDETQCAYILPFQRNRSGWRLHTDYLSLGDDDRRLESASLRVVNRGDTSIGVTNIGLFPNLLTKEAEEASAAYDPDKMILYGLEADLPILR